MSKAIGIDLGTTNSCVSVFTGGRATVVPNQEGSATTPSMVAFTPAGMRLVGAIAKRQILTNPENTVYSAKRLIGRKYDSPETRMALKYLSYPITSAENGDVMFRVMGRVVSIPEIQAEILRSMKKTAELYLGESVSEAVITVPAYFNDAQRQATKDAGLIAGLGVLRIINEPTAASLAYGLDHGHRRLMAVYDLGGGTFDISILEIGGGIFQVKATSGDTFLGGDDFDRRIIDWLVGIFKEQEGHDLSADRIVLQRLRDAAEEAKHVLSSEEETVISLPFAAITPAGPKHLRAALTRRKLEELTEDLVQRTLGPCRQALADSHLRPDAIEEVVMVGGQTRMPRVREVVRDFFGREPHVKLNPDEVVALGAAVQAAVLKGDYSEVVLLDVTPLTLGMETKGKIFTPFIDRNTTIPTRKTLVFTTTEDNQSSVTIHVLQGERKMASDNISLANFDLIGLPPAPRGLPKIEVTFDVDADGILSVSARNLSSGETQAVRVTPSGGLSAEDIGRIIAEADENARRDEIQKALALLGNEAEAAIYTAEKLARSHGAQMPSEQQEHLLAVIAHLRTSMAKSDRAQMERQLNELRLMTQNILNNLL